MGVYIGKSARLPSEYQEVEYIQSSGTQYIDTGVIPKTTTKVELKTMVTGFSNSNGGSVYGAWYNYSSNGRFNLRYTTDGGYYFGYGSNNGANNKVSVGLNTEAVITNYISGGIVHNIVNGTDSSYSGATFTEYTGTMYIFKRNTGTGTDGSFTYSRIYYFKIWDNGTLVRNFIPCYRIADGVIGLYDLVNNQFYTNSGSGTFSKGEDVLDKIDIVDAYVGSPFSPITTAGIYHNSDLGLISLSSDGSTWITIADKNLGATQVYNSGDTLSEANCGKYYQFGNNFGFPFVLTTNVSYTRVSTSGYGPGNYYSSSTFISNNADRSNPSNNNLRGGTTGTNEAMQGPCPSGFHVPKSTELYTLQYLFSGLSDYYKYLKMPLNGFMSYIYADGIQGRGSQGRIGSADANGNYWNRVLLFTTSGVSNTSTYKSNAVSIRPMKNEAVQPDDTWTVLYQPS